MQDDLIYGTYVYHIVITTWITHRLDLPVQEGLLNNYEYQGRAVAGGWVVVISLFIIHHTGGDPSPGIL